MRITLSLDPDVESLVNAARREKRTTLKKVINDAIRAGLSQQTAVRFRQRSSPRGFRADVNYDKLSSWS